MKLSPLILFAGALSSASAFAPAAHKAFLPKKSLGTRHESCVLNLALVTHSQQLTSSHSSHSLSTVSRFMAEEKPFFATNEVEAPANADEMTLEEEIQAMVDKEVEKGKLVSKLKTSDGVDYAPWMKISEEDEKAIYQTMKEKAMARRKRQEEQQNVSGNLYLDSQAQELSGTGLNSKIMGMDVELEWATSAETNTKGFLVKRRPAKTNDFQTIASFESWGPLVSKGAEGGVYRYLDADVGPGGWVYRVTECDNNNKESDICQCLVEVQTEDEQKAAMIAAVGIAVLGVAAVLAGILLDPMDGF